MASATKEDVLQRIKSSQQLPSPPGVALRILELDKSDDVEVDEIAQTISADPVLTAKLIQYCNSPIVGLAKPVSNINQAVIALGMRPLKMLALSFSFLDTSQQEPSAIDLDNFWSHSLAHAVAAQTICRKIRKNADDGFISALVSQIGRLALAVCCRREDHLINFRVNDDVDADPLDIEREVLGITCHEISAQLLADWEFPENILTAIAKIDSDPESKRGVDHAITLGKALAHIVIDSDSTKIEEFREYAETYLDLDEIDQDELFENFITCWNEFAKILSFDESECKSLAQIQAEAQSRLMNHSMRVQMENTALVREKVQLEESAITDSMTGLGNRRAFEQRASEELRRASRERQPFVMMVIDIDFFKKFNDTYGHLAGDAILKHVVECMKSKTRRYDLMFRYGGEEFVIVVPECGEFAACSVAERLRRAVEESSMEFEGQELRCTISIGVSVTDYPDYLSLEETFSRADQALYTAKNAGRNTFHIMDDVVK